MAAVLWVGASPALAQDPASPDAPIADPASAPPADPPPPPADRTPEEMLQHAILLYQSGESRAARDEIQAVLAVGPALAPTVRQGALAWLGEIMLAEQGLTAARNSFEALLVEAPDFTMDPFQHSPEACAAFDQVREQWRARRPSPPDDTPVPLPSPRGRWPAVSLVPGGYVYFERGRPLPGAIIGGVQLAGTAVSVVTGVELMRTRRTISESDLEGQARYRRLSTWNVLTGSLAWAAYATPVVVETIRWGARTPVSLRVGPGGLAVAGTF